MLGSGSFLFGHVLELARTFSLIATHRSVRVYPLCNAYRNELNLVTDVSRGCVEGVGLSETSLLYSRSPRISTSGSSGHSILHFLSRGDLLSDRTIFDVCLVCIVRLSLSHIPEGVKNIHCFSEVLLWSSYHHRKRRELRSQIPHSEYGIILSRLVCFIKVTCHAPLLAHAYLSSLRAWHFSAQVLPAVQIKCRLRCAQMLALLLIPMNIRSHRKTDVLGDASLEHADV